MQTYTHALVGGAAGISLFPDNLFAQCVLVAGSVLPDVPDAIKMIMDKVRGKKPFADLTRSALINNMFNSFFVWMGMLVVVHVVIAVGQSDMESLFATKLYPFCLGGLLHWLIDAYTHAEERFSKTDSKMFWPLKITTRGVWEYRYDHGILRPKPFELIVCLLLIFYICYCVYPHLAVYLARCVFFALLGQMYEVNIVPYMELTNACVCVYLWVIKAWVYPEFLFIYKQV